MHPASEQHIPDGLLAASVLLAENSRQGSATSTHAMYQGFGFAISSTSLGIKGSLYDGRVRSRCTGKERDAESGLDYFGARYYGSSMGRFMSPDWSGGASAVPYADFSDPQSLNLYSYVRNNPLSRADPDGHLGCGFLWLSNCPTPPPPPAPPAPTTPAVVTPGTPQNNLVL
jgi:RHS repeat-associated protein